MILEAFESLSDDGYLTTDFEISLLKVLLNRGHKHLSILHGELFGELVRIADNSHDSAAIVFFVVYLSQRAWTTRAV